MSYLANDTVIHHKFVAQADGTFTLDGNHGSWTSLAETVAQAKAQAGRKRGLARMTPVALGDARALWRAVLQPYTHLPPPPSFFFFLIATG